MILTLLKREFFHIVALIVVEKSFGYFLSFYGWVFLSFVHLIVGVDRGKVALETFIYIDHRRKH
jgi:hypothetical protein